VSAARRYRATVAYVGTGFHGWQIQRNAPRTVQAILHDALRHVAGAPVRVEGASRTDTGVHADGQVVHFDLAQPQAPRSIREAVNDCLPDDLRLLDVAEADPGFHARFGAAWKEYVYRWSRAAVIAPRDAPFVAPLSARARADLMQEAAARAAGTRDFRIFGVQRPPSEPSVRSLHAVSIEESGEELRAIFRGDGFLRGMVRSICGVLADASRGRVPPGRVTELLEEGDRRGLSHKAAAKGLTLVRVSYSPWKPLN
jgi:tRNA pseudouridine38-40 synthase